MPRDWDQLRIELRLEPPPRLRGLHELWLSKRQGRPVPDRADIDPLIECDSRLLPNLFLLDVLEEPLDFQVRLVGTALVTIEGRDHTGRRLGACGLGRYEGMLRAIFEKVVADRSPLSFTGSLLWRDSEWLDVEALQLPLTKGGASVAMILGCVLCLPIRGRRAP